MKLTQNKINEIIIDVLGEEGLRLVKELKDRENVSEFNLATKLRKDIKLIRHMLYKLYNYNLVSSTRKKDKQKGWYIYYWTIVPENIKFLYLKNKKIHLTKLKEQLQKEQNEQFFTCSKKCVRLDFNQAIDFEFRCPECGKLISQDQNPKRFSELQKKIEKLEKELKNKEKKSIKRKTQPKAKKTTKKLQIKKTKTIKKKIKAKKTKSQTKSKAKKTKKSKK